MFGIDEDIGLLRRSAAYILKTKLICISAVELVADDRFDLMSSDETVIKNDDEPSNILVRNDEEFDSIVSKIKSRRKEKSTDQNKTSSRSHLCIVMKLEGDDKNKMVFVDLAGFEKPKGKENTEETRYINESLFKLNNVLLNVSRNQIADFKSTELTKFLKPYLKASSRTLMFYHVPNHSAKKGLEYIKDIFASNQGLKRNINRLPLSNITNNKKSRFATTT